MSQLVLIGVALEEAPDHVGGVIRLRAAPMGFVFKITHGGSHTLYGMLGHDVFAFASVKNGR